MRRRRRLANHRGTTVGEIKHRTVETNGIHMHIAESGAGPPVVLCHGFPESWYSWRHQLHALAEAGLHGIAPDMRGYGQTDRPEQLDRYTLLHLVGDVVGLLDALGAETAAIVGHGIVASMAHRSGRGFLRKRICAHGISRGAELVPQHGPKLGTLSACVWSAGESPGAVHRRGPRSRFGLSRDGPSHRQPVEVCAAAPGNASVSRLRSLDPAGASPGGQPGCN